MTVVDVPAAVQVRFFVTASPQAAGRGKHASSPQCFLTSLERGMSGMMKARV